MSLTYQEFQDNFVVSIKNYESPHEDEEGVFDFAVGFNIVCNNNRRNNYFGIHLSSNDVLVPNPNESDVINEAWRIMTPEIQTWAGAVVNSSNLLGANYVPNSNLGFDNASNLSLATFDSNFNTVLVRFDVYPSIKPTCWCVGFHASLKTNDSIHRYVDSQVKVDMFHNDHTENEFIDKGWSNVKENLGTWAEGVLNMSPQINTEFTPEPWL